MNLSPRDLGGGIALKLTTALVIAVNLGILNLGAYER
jgi:hypothetical protein